MAYFPYIYLGEMDYAFSLAKLYMGVKILYITLLVSPRIFYALGI